MVSRKNTEIEQAKTKQLLSNVSSLVASLSTRDNEKLELKKMIDDRKDFVLVDVREKQEWDMCSIKMAKLIPLSRIMKGDLGEFNEISKDRPIVLHCRSGVRSLAALEILKNKGYKKLKSLAGGIEEWAVKIDKTIDVH